MHFLPKTMKINMSHDVFHLGSESGHIPRGTWPHPDGSRGTKSSWTCLIYTSFRKWWSLICHTMGFTWGLEVSTSPGAPDHTRIAVDGQNGPKTLWLVKYPRNDAWNGQNLTKNIDFRSNINLGGLRYPNTTRIISGVVKPIRSIFWPLEVEASGSPTNA